MSKKLEEYVTKRILITGDLPLEFVPIDFTLPLEHID